MFDKKNFSSWCEKIQKTARGVDFFYIQNGDEFLTENPDKSRNIFYQMTHFQTSNAILLIKMVDLKIFLFTDGRYIESAQKFFQNEDQIVVKLMEKNAIAELIDGKKIGLLSELTTKKTLSNMERKSKVECFTFANINFQYQQRPTKQESIPSSATTQEKILQIFQRSDAEYIYISNVYAASWILNKRDFSKQACNVEEKIIIDKHGRYTSISSDNDFIEFSGKTIYVDFVEITIADHKHMLSADILIKEISLAEKIFPIQATKTQEEIDNIASAHEKHGLALTKTINYIKQKKYISEGEIEKQLLAFCQQDSDFLSNSFDTIAGIDANSSLIHYRAGTFDKTTTENSVILIDCGGQYKFGTTDVTRMVLLGDVSEKFKFHYNLVIKSHITLAMHVFPCNTLAKDLDFIARNEILKHNLDYNHSTGHGVGYCLNVHEWPSISKFSNYSLAENIVVSIEPGIYIPNEYGIRVENLYTIKKFDANHFHFQPLTKVKLDLSILDENMFSENEINFLNCLQLISL